MRRELGSAAGALIAGRGYQRLGFASLGDYARERLGVSGAMLESAAWLAKRLDALPLIGAAVDRKTLTWTQARAICSVARPETQAYWLARAARCSAEELLARTRATRRSAPRDPDADADAREIDGEPAATFRLACPARVRALWRRALGLASQVAGAPLPAWRAAEAIAAEAFAGRPDGMPFGDRVRSTAAWLAQRGERAAAADAPPRAHGGGAAQPARGGEPSPQRAAAADGAPAERHDPFALDARLRFALESLQPREPRVGRLLHLLVEQRLHRALGFRSLDDYVRERLGISARKAWALLKVERRARSAPALAAAYETARLSWVRALALLPVVDRDNAEAWVARATGVTVRRLVDEVDWVLETRDALGSHVPLDPPPPGSALPSAALAALMAECRGAALGARVHIGRDPEPVDTSGRECRKTSLGDGAASGRATVEVVDASIALTAPLSVVALLRDAMDAFARADEPRWRSLERLLRHVVADWLRLPRHRDPVFARDGWRCTVPGCTARRNLHDHHLHFRSRGGNNARTNRTTACAPHHRYGIHRGAIRAFGTAPHPICWELGVRPGAPPLLRYVGDVIVTPDDRATTADARTASEPPKARKA